jgi:hypothetical protein
LVSERKIRVEAREKRVKRLETLEEIACAHQSVSEF